MDRKRRAAIGGGSWRREGDPELLRAQVGIFGSILDFRNVLRSVALSDVLSLALNLWRFGEWNGGVWKGLEWLC